jgi:hypothetical protein
MTDTPDAVVGGVDLHLVHPVEPTQGAQVGNDLPPQQCGRCRLLFDGDPTLHPPAQPGWWLCPPCRATLLGPTHSSKRGPPSTRRHAMNHQAKDRTWEPQETS